MHFSYDFIEKFFSLIFALRSFLKRSKRETVFLDIFINVIYFSVACFLDGEEEKRRNFYHLQVYETDLRKVVAWLLFFGGANTAPFAYQLMAPPSDCQTSKTLSSFNEV